MIKAIIGPTASGKTSLAIELADTAGGEIINMDAYAMYRGMDIGTAKPTLEEQARVAHHLIDILEIHDNATVAQYQQYARNCVKLIEAKGKPVFAVGGSGLYVRALCDQITFPGTDPQVRARLEAECTKVGALEMYRRLQSVDPLAASNLHWNNSRRVIRALEVIELTGQPYSATMPSYETYQPTLFIGLRREDTDIDTRIEKRTKAMFAAGFIEEVRKLKAAGLEQTRTASKATGYAEVLRLLRGEINETEAIEAVALATRQLVRRQMKWFRKDPRINWIDATGKSEAEIYTAATEISEKATGGLPE
ncbi:tRNA (adenosine(37)-N6)-dimethylallyltransferase MiaA [Gleimia sp. 6138-11-ORH1]|uniref:tRNA (adenosine(37)-N6)-dimethylallyltransferase MiaA n=1 Tax=Gleimia sp. 6138-11-ORH1 TaxID=2973937 RepID=UPI002167F90F|nr:tRNA (adenosine(37)-N6)-dimethylallyltransferase MiaA [Gleimia sp. 6138-11-ORH1]MCS4484238.1 tRNA (adenosine(37)-N6)-dimethylallyltransferase MiaA [Gleimia sp. 6138-11-ORH1]